MRSNKLSDQAMTDDKDGIVLRMGQRVRLLVIVVGLAIFLILATLALAAATLGLVNNRLPASTKEKLSLNSQYAETIQVSEALEHLNELQRIATGAQGTRAINTPGFNQTLDYITSYLSAHTDFKVTKSFFDVRTFQLSRNPILLSSIKDFIKNHTYSTNLATAEFLYVQYSSSANFSDFVPLVAIPNVGCSDADWQAPGSSVSGQVALVKRGECTFVEKGVLAAKYNVAGLLLYNDGTAPDRLPPILASLGQSNRLPALFLSFALGDELASAAQDSTANAGVRMEIAVANDAPYPVGNVCADTPTGDVTQTIVIGSHSDSVPAGPGINDNGSGSAANLALAATLARLFKTADYAKFKYRVRFCWWGAEEVGLLGSAAHVATASTSTVVGERLQDYLINLNFDMLGSPNYIFGIYDGKTANNATPPTAIPGSNKISSLFRDWFIQQNLPWDFTDFSGRSDYGPFLARGIVAGGLFSGADETKTQEQRDRYDRILGQGLGGIAGAIQDPCYHQACDSIQNINEFALQKMIQAAAYVIESLGQQNDLKAWLYPSGQVQRSDNPSQKQPMYDSVNEYFRLPYL